jgi:hypothetical protein
MTAPLTLAELVARTRAPGSLVPTPPLSTAPELAPIGPAPIGTPPGLAPGGPGAVAACELITGREIAAVAGKLGRHKSEDKQTVGRAMLKALRGEVWAGDGHRNTTMFQVAGELVEAYPNLDPGSVVLAFSAAISNAQLNGSKYTEEKLYSALERIQDERGNRIRMINALGGLGIEFGAAVPNWTAQPGAAQADTRAAALNALGFDTLIVRANGDFYLRTPDRGTYDWKLTSTIDLRTKMVNLFGRENGTVITHQDGEFVGAEKICEVYARVADKTIHDYTSPATTFDPARNVLSVGLPANLPEPQEDPRVARWLKELAGGRDHDLLEFYDWISGTTREYIHRPAAALVIVGAKDAGKSLFMLALAGTWGVLPVKLANAVEKFNGALLSSPFWHADERMPEEMTEACFRETVPERHRLVEPKGREKVELRGCGRLVFTLNSVEDLHVGTSRGPDAVDAVAGRIAYFDCSRRARELADAQAPLRLPLSWDLDLAAMVGHLRYVQTTVTPREQRFLGARLDNAGARAVVINQSVKRAEGYLDAIGDYLTDPVAWEKEYRATSQWTIPGRNFPLVTQDGKLYVWTTELASRIGDREPRYLDSLLRPGRARLRFGGVRGSFREIDTERLVEARPELYAAIVSTCSGDTKERLGLTD